MSFESESSWNMPGMMEPVLAGGTLGAAPSARSGVKPAMYARGGRALPEVLLRASALLLLALVLALVGDVFGFADAG